MSKFICDGDVFKKKINGVDYELRIVSDDYAENPRDWDGNFSHLYCWHRRYTLGDVNPYNDIEECLNDLVESSKLSQLDKDSIMKMFDDDTLTVKQRHLNVIKALAVFADVYVGYLYLYDHSGITMSVSDFHDPWDSGIVGLGIVYKKDVVENTCFKEDNWFAGAMEVLADEVGTYDLYIRGECYGFELYRLEKCDCCGQVNEELEDSCGGFLGNDITENGMLDHIDPAFIDLFKEDK